MSAKDNKPIRKLGIKSELIGVDRAKSYIAYRFLCSLYEMEYGAEKPIYECVCLYILLLYMLTSADNEMRSICEMNTHSVFMYIFLCRKCGVLVQCFFASFNLIVNTNLTIER